MTATPTTAAIARGWLQTGQAPSQRAPEVARALALLGRNLPATPAALRGLGADIEQALLQEAEAQTALELTSLIAEHAADKAVAKNAKKVLFKWKQKGLSVPDRHHGRAPVDLSARPEPLPSFASSIDGAGGQLIFLGGWTPGEGANCIMAMLSDRDGLLSAYYVPNTSRTQQKELIGRLHASIPGFTCQVPEDFAAGRLRWALDLRDGKGLGFEGDVAEVRRALAHAEPVPEIDIALDPEDEAALDQHLDASAALAAEPCFSGWFALDRQELKLLQDGAKAIAADADDVPGQVRELRLRAWQAWLGQVGAEKLATRLEINAWLLAATQKRDQALQALACARALRLADRPWTQLGLMAASVEKQASLASLIALAGPAAAPAAPGPAAAAP